MNSIRIMHPYLFLVVIPLIAIVLVGLFLLPKAKRKNVKNIISTVLHVFICLFLTLSFVDIQYLKKDQKSEVVLLVDCSASTIENQEDEIQEEVKKIFAEKSSQTSVGIIGFANEPVVLEKMRKDLPLNFSLTKSLKREAPDSFSEESSDIKAALELALTQFTSDQHREIILLSDGLETDFEAEDALHEILQENIKVDTIDLSLENRVEISIDQVQYTERAFFNHEENVTISVRSSKESKAKLSLTSKGSVLHEEEVTLNRGLNSFSYPLSTGENGVFSYTVTITSLDGADTFEENNTYSFTQEVTSDFRILFLGATQEELNNLRSIYTSSLYQPDITPYLNDYENIPYTFEELLPYDEFIFSDFNVNELPQDHQESFVSSLKSLVSNAGKSLFTFGATYSNVENSLSSLSYSDLLPIQYTSEGRAIVLLIDRSSSMQENDKLLKVKEGAVQCLDLLGEEDYLSIVTFQNNTDVALSLTQTTKENKKIIEEKILAIEEAEGGTQLSYGLSAAQSQLAASKLDNKQIVCLTDGIPFESETDLKTQVSNIASEGIIVSFINIASQQGVSLLKSLAQFGNGQYFYCNNAQEISKNMLSSIIVVVSNTVIQRETEIKIALSEDPSVEGITSLPKIQGFHYCRIRSGAETVLKAIYEIETESGQVTQTSVPLFAYWNYGNGKVLSFTSALGGEFSNWTRALRKDENGKHFFVNATELSCPEKKVDTCYSLSYQTNGKTSSLNVVSNRGESKKALKVSVKKEGLEEKTTSLYFDGKNYTATIDTPLSGDYQLTISDEEQKVEEDFSLRYNFSKEYQMNNGGEELLTKLSSKTGGTYQKKNSSDYSFLNSEIDTLSYASTSLYFLLTAVILLLADIFVRKSDFRKKGRAVKQNIGF